MRWQIRAMTESDISSARQLWAGSEGVELAEGDEASEVARYLARNPAMSTVAVDSAGGLVGAVLCGHDGRRGFIYHLAVAPQARRDGVGRAMMNRSLTALKQAGIKRALLLVAADNAAGRGFWQREGWDELSFARPMGLDL